MSPIGSGFARRSLRKDQVPVVKLVYRELYGLLEFSLQCNSIAMLDTFASGAKMSLQRVS